MLIRTLRRWWFRRHSHFVSADWDGLLRGLPAAAHLDQAERNKVAQMAINFLADKTIEGAGGSSADDRDHLLIAAHAALLTLKLGLHWYDGWYSVMIYADNFISSGERVDEAGVVHRNPRVLSGEAWLRGPVILSRTDVLATLHDHHGNVILHEFAHKLDMRNGAANGMPPLHRSMDRQAWTAALSRGYQHFCTSLHGPDPLPFDPYACESPGEFFAVMSEVFFVQPASLEQHLSAVYRQFCLFYRQDPAA
jgi:hypothetical protein